MPDCPSIPMDLKNFKYIGRVFLCKLGSIDLSDLSDEVLDSISSQEKDKFIYLVQVIDASAKVDHQAGDKNGGWGF